MITITTRVGKTVDIISQSDLRDPIASGTHVRAYCHIHGSDHQRSLSVNRASGWGHCFNAECMATVLVAEWNPQLARQLAHPGYGLRPLYTLEQQNTVTAPQIRQLRLLLPNETPAWQREEIEALETLALPMRAALSHSQRARSYLHERGIPLAVALASGVCYLPPALVQRLSRDEQHTMQRWSDRLVFPLASPLGRGYIGRTLCAWQPGMNENAHKVRLEEMDGPRRWIKTNPAGWFCHELDETAERIVIVEGGFDRLALLTAGFAPGQVVALTGTAAHTGWVPAQVKHIVLALDGDQGGHEAASRLTEPLRQEGFTVSTCLPPQDGRGKDWNERWHRSGINGVRPLLEACDLIRHVARSA